MPAAHILRSVATLAALLPVVSGAVEVRSGAPEAVSVTVYRSPEAAGRFELDALGGFALITETRRVSLPAGASTLRFEGVAGGIEAESAIVTGFADGVLEKNRDARLLSPSALLAASRGRPVELERTHPKTGGTERVRGILVSDADGGVVFKSAAGVEALRCSGLPETFSFEPFAGANATPTLSVRVQSATPVTRTVTLSYLARGFDWAATYSATLAGDASTIDLGAWVTLANGNGETFREADTQVVAGRLNREAGVAEPTDAGGPILAQCWPRGSTSDVDSPPVPTERMLQEDAAPMMALRSVNAPAAEPLSLAKTGMVQQEQLGDLKLYRVPDRTTVAARQMKQVRLLDQSRIPVRQIYHAECFDRGSETADGEGPVPLLRQLRTRNTLANHLGLPLPAGRIAVYAATPTRTLLIGEGEVRDHALDEELQIDLGRAPDVRAVLSTVRIAIDADGARQLPLLPGIVLRSVGRRLERRVEITNATAREADTEWTVRLDGDAALVGADHPLERVNGQPLFRLRVPAQGRAVLRYVIAKTSDLVIRAR